MAQHQVLISFNEATTEIRHEAGEIVDLSHIPDLAELIANRTVIEVEQSVVPVEWVDAAVKRHKEKSQ